jgi:LmbE family N-acetylglucosaminyl deacetylase
MERRTLVFFHAHPDDEAIATGGTMIRAADAGHRVVLVVATRGEHGEVEDGYLDPGEKLWERRVRETHAAARLLGVERVEFLGYVDSGMMGTPENDQPGSFWTADVEEAASRLAAVLTEEAADVLTIYDENGVYGHPDHIQIHRVGVRAAELAGTPRVFMSTIDQDRILRLMKEAHESGDMVLPGDLDPDDFQLGVPAHRVTTTVDVGDVADRKRAAMAAHASQISETSFFLAMKPEQFRVAFGHEDYIQCVPDPGAVPPPTDDLLGGL